MQRNAHSTESRPGREAALGRAIAEHRADLLAFVRRRVRDAATAEDILSETLARALARVGELRDDKALVAWLYRGLRNAVIDHHRRLGSTSRALEQLAAEMNAAFAPATKTVCGCVMKIAASLKPEYAQALARIEVDGEAVHAFAAEVGISNSNAAVRVFRAREALRRGVVATCGACAANGCVDCTCGSR